MSKFRIPSTQSNKDPYALERSVETLTPSANPISVTTGGNELETLTPFQIEEGKGTLGNSQYQQQALQAQKANDEDFWSLTAKGLKNLAGTVVTEVGKTPGYIGGGLMAAGNELFGDGKDSMKMMVDNSWVNAFESMNQSIKDFMPVNISKEVQEGGLGDKLSSGAWWATTGADGVGFLLAMYGPGALLKAGKVGQRITGSIEELANAGAKVDDFLNLPIDFAKPYKYSLSTARKVEGNIAAITNATVEAAAEAANTFDNIKESKKQEYLNQGLDESTADQMANQDAGKGAAAVFKTNMVILPVSNLLEEKWLWKSVGLSGQDEAAEGLINQFMKNGVLDIDGLKQATKKTFKEKAGTFAKNVGKNFAKEGVFEEGLQTITQQQVEKGNIKDNALEQFYNSITSYADDFENNKELHESIALGGLLGAGASIFQSRNEARNNEEAIYGSRSGKYDNILNKIGLRQVRKDQRGLSDLLSQNWINNYRSYDDLLTDGKLDPAKLAALPQEQQALANLHFLYDAAVEMGEKDTQEVVGQYLSANYAKAFLGQTGGKEIFRQHVENQVVPEWSKRFAQTKGREATPVEINEYKKRFLDSANQVFDNYSKVEETHYPERYYQDKENPELYKQFKQHYFNQKFQALTKSNVAQQAIARANGEMATNGIVEGAALNGIQKTIKKIQEKEIEDQKKSLEEASNYYESLFTKKGVKELYDLFKSQQEVVPEVQQEIVENEVKDLKVAEAKVENIQNAEAKIQEAESNQDQPVFIKTKDGRVLETMLDGFGNRHVFDDGNVRPVTEDELTQSTIVQPEDVQRELDKQETPISEEVLPEEPLDEKLHEAFLENDLGIGLYPTTGMHVAYSHIKGRVYDTLTDEGLPQLNDSVHQRNWFDTLDKITNINDYQVKVVNKRNANAEQLRVIMENGGNQVEDIDLFTFLYKDDSPVLIDNNPVFTSLWRPDTLYKELSKERLSARLAPMSVYNAYLESIGISSQDVIDDDLSNFSPVEYNKLESLVGKANMSADRLWYTAARWAKDDYTKWYESLQQPNTFLQPINITNGKRLVKRNEDRSIVWNKVEGNVPDFKIENQKLVNGDIVQQYTAKGVKAGNKYYNFRIGDSVLVSNDQAYRLKQSMLNSNEVKTVLYLLSLKSDVPQEAIKLPVRTVIKEKNSSGGYVDKVFEETPVFGSNTEYGILKSLINFGYGTSKGSIYLKGNNVEFIDFDGSAYGIPVVEIQKAFLDDDFSKLDKLMSFLTQKKFNVNENLLRADSDFQYPVLKRTTNGGYVIDFENKGKYKAYLLQSEKLLTDSTIAEGYPRRLARNLQFAKSPTIKTIEETEKIKEGVSEIFKSNPELSDIGTEEQYSQYLDSVFPESKTKDIVYHGSKNKNIEQFSKDFIGTTRSGGKSRLSFGEGFYFSPSKIGATEYAEEDTDDGIQFVGRVYPAILNNPELDLLPNGKPFQLLVKEPEQIHILGSKSDIQGFKDFVKGKVDPKLERLRNRKRTEIPNIRDADKIFSPTDILKQKLQNGEITKYCK